MKLLQYHLPVHRLGRHCFINPATSLLPVARATMRNGGLNDDRVNVETSSEIVTATWIAVIAVTALTSLVMLLHGLEFASKIAAMLYLAYSTYCELEHEEAAEAAEAAVAARGPARPRLLVCWTVHTAYSLVSSVLDRFLGGFILYTLIKVALLVWILAPEPVNGSDYVYRKLLSPLAKDITLLKSVLAKVLREAKTQKDMTQQRHRAATRSNSLFSPDFTTGATPGSEAADCRDPVHEHHGEKID